MSKVGKENQMGRVSSRSEWHAKLRSGSRGCAMNAQIILLVAQAHIEIPEDRNELMMMHIDIVGK